MNWNNVAKASVAIVAGVACMSAQATSHHGITASVAAEKSSLGKNDNVTVRLTITNTSSQPQLMLKWHTAFGEIEESLFEITRDGAKVPYLGAHYKRGEPKASDYYLLKPGASHTVRVELSDMYDMSITGQYAISYSAKSMQLFMANPAERGVAANSKQVDQIASEPVALWIDGRLARGTTAAKAPAPDPGGPGLTFTRCTASQQADVTSAFAAATAMANDGNSALAGAPGARYTKWFGAADTSRLTKVRANFNAIEAAFTGQPVNVDCGCKKTYYAYVYPNQPYKIYVCKAFWTAPMTGTDSKGGTLVHEMSHFTVVAGTDDWVYGQSGAASLAITDPAKAIDNADSHEYFGENTPKL